MENLPIYISLIFGLTTILTALIFFKASGNSKLVLIILLIWIDIQVFVGLSGFYTVTDTMPPRFLLLVLPPLLLVAFLFITAKGKQFIDHLNIKHLTLLHTIRIPVELVLFWLCMNKAVPQLMTFEGRNFDILSGFTAPVVYYLGFVKKVLGRKVIIWWNIISIF